MQTKAGTFYVGYPITWDWLVTNIKRGQDYLVNETRLGIPAIVQSEGIHGFLIEDATIFNSPIGRACSWNPNLIRQMAEQIAVESAALGVNQVFAPLADLARELRYGRVEETYGEDASLAGEMVYNYVRGVQSRNVSAMVKHFAAYSAPEQGLNTGPVHGGQRELRTTWLPSFHRAIIDAGAWAVMGAYHSYDAIPAISNHHIQEEILRQEWGYKFLVMSDAGATDRLFDYFKTCAVNDFECVTLATLPNGNDVEMGGGSFNYRSIPWLIGNGTLSEAEVDKAVTRVLRVKLTMGLFEHPYPAAPSFQGDSIINTPSAKTLARTLDAESIVLLQNPNKTLPLSKSSKIAVIGPFASGFMNYGDYVVSDSQYRGVQYLDGILAAIGPTSNTTVSYALGAERWSTSESHIPAAVASARAADAAVVIVGTWSRDQAQLWEGLNATTGEHVDVSTLSLFGAQRALLRAIIATHTPTVIVFSSGKPITEPWISHTSAALLQHFYPSEQGGHALADVLFGAQNPSGRLAVSFPRDVGSLPVTYDRLASARPAHPDAGFVRADGGVSFGHQYVLGSPAPWFEFGFGLSYTEFSYGAIEVSEHIVGPDEEVVLRVEVANVGNRSGAEVVQVYVRDELASVEVPGLRLRGFEKVFFEVGEVKIVEVLLRVRDWGVWGRDMVYVVEKGEFTVFVGASSGDLRGNVTLTIV